jgi:hypothetical protein
MRLVRNEILPGYCRRRPQQDNIAHAQLLASAGFLQKNEDGTYVKLYDEEGAMLAGGRDLEKLEFYWVVPPGRYET